MNNEVSSNYSRNIEANNEGVTNMHKFIKKCGTVVEVERFMQGPKLSDGYVWQCESALGHVESVWREVVEHYETKGTLFGYDEKEFMARQYK